jgi:hypothetical protein
MVGEGVRKSNTAQRMGKTVWKVEFQVYLSPALYNYLYKR